MPGEIRSVQSRILKSDLLPSEKLVGLVIAFHLNSKTKKTRISREKIAEKSGLSVASVKRAISSLHAAGIIERVRTERTSIFQPCSSNITSNVDGSPMTHQTGHIRTTQYDLDTEFSTTAEERCKRDDAAFGREQANGGLGVF